MELKSGRVLGYVIINQNNLLFAGYLHPGTKKVGYPIWVEELHNTNFDGGKASIWADEREAADVALSIFMRDGQRCTVKPVRMDHLDSWRDDDVK